MPTSPRSFPHTGHIYDLAVVGAGLAGSELAHRAALEGLDVLLVTQSLDSVGNLFHSRVRSSFPEHTLFATARARLGENADLWDFHRAVKGALEETSGIHLLQSLVTALQTTDDRGQTVEISEDVEAHGEATAPNSQALLARTPLRLETWEGVPRLARRAALCVGSFLEGQLVIGSSVENAGRLSEVAYDDLYRDLLGHGLRLVPLEREVLSVEGSLPYRVRFQAIAQSELEGFALRKLPGVLALGQCVAGEHSYASVLEDAGRALADVLSNLELEG